MAQIKYWVWLSSHTELSPRTKQKLLEHYGDPERAFFSPEGDFKNVPGISCQDAKRLEERDISGAEHILDECRRMNIRIIALNDSAYPVRLKNTPCPPVVLYVKGILPNVDDSPAVAVIGTRSATAYGMKMGAKLAYECVRSGAVIITAMSHGIDDYAARAALRAGGRCIGVLGTAISEPTDELQSDIAAYGALVSEYPPGTKGMRHFFRDRNRIAAGLCCGVAVAEAPEESGTLLFAREAYEQGREIFAVPGNADSPNSMGTNSLIKQGAKAVTCGWDIMEEFELMFPGKVTDPVTAPFSALNLPVPERTEDTPKPKKKEPPEHVDAPHSTEKVIDKENDGVYIDLRQKLQGLNEEQLSIVSVIRKDGTHIDEIIEGTAMSTAKVLSQLTILEIKGVVKRSAGRCFVLNIPTK